MLAARARYSLRECAFGRLACGAPCKCDATGNRVRFWRHSMTRGYADWDVDVAVVGAGVAGLFAATRILRRVPEARVVIYESRKEPGGRIQTVRDEEGRPLYERGAWRIPAHHTRTRALYSEYAIDLSPSSSSAPGAVHVGKPPDFSRLAADGLLDPALSLWDIVASTDAAVGGAQSADRDTGYMDTTHAASTTAVYGVGALAPRAGGHYVPRSAGMSSVIYAMADEAIARGARLCLAHQVTDVEKAHGGTFVLRVRSATTGRSTVRAASVCVAVPPAAALAWSVSRRWLLPMLHAVRPKALMHVYAETDAAPTARGKRNFRILLGDSPLAQVISGDYADGSIFQAAYASGTLALHWLHRWQSAGSGEELREDVHALLRRDAVDALDVPPLRRVMPCYFARAIHMWRPAPSFDEDEAASRSALPLAHAGARNFAWCNEAFSTAQAWIEGALRQAEAAAKYVVASLRGTAEPGVPMPSSAVPPDCVRLYGWDVPVASFADAHPGGAAAIEQHLGTEATQAFEHIGHSPNAYAIVYALALQRSRARQRDDKASS